MLATSSSLAHAVSSGARSPRAARRDAAPSWPAAGAAAGAAGAASGAAVRAPQAAPLGSSHGKEATSSGLVAPLASRKVPAAPGGVSAGPSGPYAAPAGARPAQQPMSWRPGQRTVFQVFLREQASAGVTALEPAACAPATGGGRRDLPGCARRAHRRPTWPARAAARRAPRRATAARRPRRSGWWQPRRTHRPHRPLGTPRLRRARPPGCPQDQPALLRIRIYHSARTYAACKHRSECRHITAYARMRCSDRSWMRSKWRGR